MYKKFLSAYILLILLLLLSGCGCSIETVDEHNSKIEREALERSSALDALLNQTEASREQETSPDYEADISDMVSDSKITENTGTETDADTAGPDNTTAAETKAYESQTAENQTTAPYIKVHITITCSKVVDNPDLSTDAKLPKDGIILDGYVAVRNGDSVFDALKAAADDNGISLSYTKSGGSVYIGGINGLNEKQCGRYSGWRYSVNNVYPNVGCGGYTLSDGDSILFGYGVTYNDSY